MYKNSEMMTSPVVTNAINLATSNPIVVGVTAVCCTKCSVASVVNCAKGETSKAGIVGDIFSFLVRKRDFRLE